MLLVSFRFCIHFLSLLFIVHFKWSNDISHIQLCNVSVYVTREMKCCSILLSRTVCYCMIVLGVVGWIYCYNVKLIKKWNGGGACACASNITKKINFILLFIVYISLPLFSSVFFSTLYYRVLMLYFVHYP